MNEENSVQRTLEFSLNFLERNASGRQPVSLVVTTTACDGQHQEKKTDIKYEIRYIPKITKGENEFWQKMITGLMPYIAIILIAAITLFLFVGYKGNSSPVATLPMPAVKASASIDIKR